MGFLLRGSADPERLLFDVFDFITLEGAGCVSFGGGRPEGGGYVFIPLETISG